MYDWAAMGMYCVYRCDTCGWEFDTWGPREFFRDAAGNRRPCGHPCPVSPEAERRGIHGFDAQMYCRTCGRTCEAVLAEFERPLRDPVQAWGEHQGAHQAEPRCPGCGNAGLLVALPDEAVVMCPQCRQGRMALAGGGIS